MTDVLAFEGVSIAHRGRRGRLAIVDGLDLTIAPGEAFGLVGESGCGKSTVALAAMRYLPRGMTVEAGRILFEGHNLATLGDDLRFVTITSQATLAEGSELAVEVVPSSAMKCARCWHYRDDVGHDPGHPTLCGRCTSNLYGSGEVRKVA